MELSIEVLKDRQFLHDFRCGVPAMDRFIQAGLYLSVLHHYCQAYIVKLGEEVIALFALSFDSLDLDEDDKNDLMTGISVADTPLLTENYKEIFLSKPHYPALEIAYLAVDERYSRQGWGRVIIEAIADKAQTQEMAGCQFLTVEALNVQGHNAVTFYSKCGFSPSEYPNPNKGTLRMFRTLYSEKEEE